MRIVFLLPLLALSLAGCFSAPTSAPSPVLRIYSSDEYRSESGKRMCKSFLDSYCNTLYSPGNSGNLEIKTSATSTKILQGDTQNQFPQVFYRYSRAKLRNQHNFPRDFATVLSRANYFQKLEAFITRKPFDKMTFTERLAADQQNYELGSIWQAAVNESVILRMNRKYPEFYALSERMIPLELQLERTRVRRNLISEISKTIWKDDENWDRVEKTFMRLQKSYARVIEKLDIPESLRKDWAKRIAEVRLVLPGALPAISNEECSTVTVNAFYYTYLNVITVCAGDFNSEDILQTLAHEMGHVLDFNRSEYLFQSKSKMAGELAKLRRNVCQPATFSCDQWRGFSKNFDSLLKSLDGYKTDLPEFQSCLKRRPTTKTLGEADVERFSTSIVNDRISELASSDRFLRITKSEIPRASGKPQKNPNYFNPCSYYLWSNGEEPIDDELTTLIFFTANYRCSEEDDNQRLRDSIEVARDMSKKITAKSIQSEGEFSNRNELEMGGYASPPEERFADVVGSYAMADDLAQIPYDWERRNKFLSGVSWMCIEPSLASRFPEESSVEKEFVYESHTEGDQRRKELFSTPVREVLGCEKDFQFNECSLPFKPTK